MHGDAGDLDDDDVDFEALHRCVAAIDSDEVLRFRGSVKDIGIMHELIHEYTHAEIVQFINMMEGASLAGYDDIGGYIDTVPHYEKLSALWGGPPNDAAHLFSPMYALSWLSIEQAGEYDAEATDCAIASIIDGLPRTGVDWGLDEHGRSPLMYAIQANHGPRTIEALCNRGAFFAESEHSAAVRALVCDAPLQCMEGALISLQHANPIHGDFICGLFDLKPQLNAMGTALHMCCNMVSIEDGLFDRMCILLEYGVDPKCMTTVGNLRAADMLAIRASKAMQGSDIQRELIKCVRHLSEQPAGPIRHHLREIGKLMTMRGVPHETEEKVIREAY
jgi:hypothetical protein